jgi:arylsulfatase A-like enzyme
MTMSKDRVFQLCDIEHGLLINFGGSRFSIKKYAMSGASSSRLSWLPTLLPSWFLLLLFFFSSFCIFCGHSFAAEPKADKPNVLFILTDDLGWGDLRCYGNTRVKTPNLDRLAREGALFTQFYVNAAVCSPSRAAFMTGRFPGRLGIHTVISGTRRNQQTGVPEFVDPNKPFLTRLLKDAGYATAHFGKWHLGSNARNVPLPGAYGIDDHRTTTTVRGAPTWEDANTPEARSRSTAQIIDETIRFISSKRDQPFYVNVWTRLPHAPLHPSPAQLEPYKHLQPDPQLPYLSALQIYLASITDIDTQVGRLLRKLKELDLEKNTLVLFTSDNGPEDIEVRRAGYSGVGSPGPFRGRKRSLYEGGVRVPFIVRWPGHVPAGRVDDTSVLSAVDFLPTISRLAGVTLPEELAADGEDVSDILLGKARARGKPLFWEWRFRIAGPILNRSPRLAMRDGPWKLLMNPDRSRVELYDLRKDPTETDNQAGAHPEVVNRLARELLAWHKSLPRGPVDPAAGKNAYPWPRASAGKLP